MTHRMVGVLLLLAAANGRAQGVQRDTVAIWLSRRLPSDFILGESRRRCVTFIVDGQNAHALSVAGADSTLISGLRGMCYLGSALEVATDRPGATVKVEDRAVGSAPWSGPVPPNHVSVVVEQGTWSQRVTVDVHENQFVRVTFHVPSDTVAVPVVLSALRLAQLAADTANYVPKTPPPTPPVRPSGRRTLGGTLIGALVGGAAGAGIGVAACKSSSTIFTYNPTLGYNTPNGTSSSLNAGCAVATTGGGLLVGGFVGNLIARAGYGASMRRYEEAQQRYSATFAQWLRNKASDSTETIHERRTAYAAALADVDRAAAAQRANAATRAHNAALGGPDIVVEPARRLAHAASSPASLP